MLLSLILIPLLGMIISSFLKEIRYIKRIGYITTIVNFILSIILLMNYDNTSFNYQFVNEYNAFLHYPIKLGVDGISIYFVLLTCLLMPIVLLISMKNEARNDMNNLKTFIILILLLEALLIGVFLVLDLWLFYILFESILPPLFIYIGIFGSKNRIKAAYYLFLYTLGGSLTMLLSFLAILHITGTTDFIILSDSLIDFQLQKILFWGIFISILVKTPLFPFHLWLPYAHSESPIGGSILLAGVILKLALYGILRILIPILPEASLYYTPIIYTICIITIIYTSMVTLRLIDLKTIIAYSSISHMGICLMGAFSNTIQGIQGSILLGITHGLISPVLFIIVGAILYDRYHTRIILYYKGITQIMPLCSTLFFLAILANCGTPFTGNFIGEFLCLTGAFQKSSVLTTLATTSVFFSAAYSIYLYNRIAGGIKGKYMSTTSDLTRKEFYVLSPLIIITFILGVNPNIVLDDILIATNKLIYTLPL